MAKKYILDKTFDVGVTYEAESDKAYVVRAAGTNSFGAATLNVAGVNCLSVVDKVARIAASYSEQIPPAELGDLFVVIPPNKKFSFTGDSGSKLRLIGEIWELAPGEVLPTNLLSRYAEQGKRYLSFQHSWFSKGTDTAWPADEENTVLAFTAPAGERHTFKRGVYGTIANLAAAHAPGDWGIRFYKQDAPLDILASAMGDLGVDLWSMHFIFDTVAYHRLFSLADMPIVLEPGRRLTVKARNVSGAAKTPATGTSITVTVTIQDEVELLS